MSYGFGRGRVSNPVPAAEEDWDAEIDQGMSNLSVGQQPQFGGGFSNGYSNNSGGNHSNSFNANDAWDDNFEPKEPQKKHIPTQEYYRGGGHGAGRGLGRAKPSSGMGDSRAGFGGSSAFDRSSDADSNSTRIHVASHKCGRIVGRGGSRIREIQDETGARINVRSYSNVEIHPF